MVSCVTYGKSFQVPPSPSSTQSHPPLLHTLALPIIQIDSDKYPKLMAKFNVTGLPTLILFKEGKELQRIEGGLPAEPLMQQLRYFLAGAAAASAEAASSGGGGGTQGGDACAPPPPPPQDACKPPPRDACAPPPQE